MANQVVWVDIPVLDLDLAIRYYSAVLGGEVQKQEYPGMAIGLLPGYDSDVSGCLFTKDDERPSATGLLIYLNAKGRLDEAIGVVELNGGKVLQPRHQIGPHGYRAIILDSEGNRVRSILGEFDRAVCKVFLWKEDVPVSKVKRKKGPNADLVEAARSHRDQILMFHDQRGGTQPVILLDFQRLRLRSYPFKEYKAKVRAESQQMLNEEYEKAIAKNKVLVVVWDSATRRLATIKLRREMIQP